MNWKYLPFDFPGLNRQMARIAEKKAALESFLSLLARQGKIDAFKEGRNWLTTKKAVEDYVEKRERKR